MREGDRIGALATDVSLVVVSILVISYGTLGLLHLVNTSFSSPKAVPQICLDLLFSLFRKILLWSLSQ